MTERPYATLLCIDRLRYYKYYSELLGIWLKEICVIKNQVWETYYVFMICLNWEKDKIIFYLLLWKYSNKNKWHSLYDSLCGAHISAKVSEYVQII